MGICGIYFSKMLQNRVKIFSLQQLHGVKGFCKIVNWKQSISESKTEGKNIPAARLVRQAVGEATGLLQWPCSLSVIPRSGQITGSHTECFLFNLLHSNVLSSFKWGSLKAVVLYPKDSVYNGRISLTATSKQIRARETLHRPTRNLKAEQPSGLWRFSHQNHCIAFPPLSCLPSPSSVPATDFVWFPASKPLMIGKCNNGDLSSLSSSTKY